MSSSSARLPFSEALTTLHFCLLHEAESSDAAMHSDAWVRSVYVAWNRLHLAWMHDEEGFMEEEEWFEWEGQLWMMLGRVNCDLVEDSCEEFNALVAEALKCGINIELIEMESSSQSEVAIPPPPPPVVRAPSPVQIPEPLPVPVPSPAVQDLIPPMPHTPTPKPESSVPAPLPPPPVKYKFGPKCINDGPGFGSRHKKVEVLVPRLTTEVRAPAPSPTPPPIAGPSRLRKRVLSSDEDQAPSPKRPRQTQSPPRLTRAQKQKGRAVDNPESKLRTGRPRKVTDETVTIVRKRGGLGEPVPKNARIVANEDLRPMGLLIPDQDFGDYVGCQGAFFKRELAGKVGHFMSVACDSCSKANAQCRSVRSGSSKCFRCAIHKHDCVVKNRPYVNTLEPVFVPETPLVSEIRVLLKRLRQEGRQMNNTDDNIPSLFRANHLDNITLVSELFEQGVVEGEALVDLEAEEVPSDEDSDAGQDQLPDED
ncbi:hypothetical protein ARMSODRAFT_983958 [Armillaria solidipes]|uniref:Uncharacterized protein n=1 Tax=Armillaria solidipes TaxID=1076256 RepID=A0A2H3B385_9AGAR|nr:hypothetical protein ARMSODRAFT_983958 [Armillaria solidipes]